MVAIMDRTRRAFVAGVTGLILVPAFAAAADDKRTYRVKARLDRNRDKKTIRQVELVLPPGKTGDALDGSWAYDRMPRTPRGLYVSCTVKDAGKLHLKLDAEYGQANNEQAGGNNFAVFDSKTSLDDDFTAGTPVAFPWTIAGEDHTLIVSVDPVAPKES